jgi:hypothetical protein
MNDLEGGSCSDVAKKCFKFYVILCRSKNICSSSSTKMIAAKKYMIKCIVPTICVLEGINVVTLRTRERWWWKGREGGRSSF